MYVIQIKVVVNNIQIRFKKTLFNISSKNSDKIEPAIEDKGPGLHSFCSKIA